MTPSSFSGLISHFLDFDFTFFDFLFRFRVHYFGIAIYFVNQFLKESSRLQQTEAQGKLMGASHSVSEKSIYEFTVKVLTFLSNFTKPSFFIIQFSRFLIKLFMFHIGCKGKRREPQQL